MKSLRIYLPILFLWKFLINTQLNIAVWTLFHDGHIKIKIGSDDEFKLIGNIQIKNLSLLTRVYRTSHV